MPVSRVLTAVIVLAAVGLVGCSDAQPAPGPVSPAQPSPEPPEVARVAAPAFGGDCAAALTEAEVAAASGSRTARLVRSWPEALAAGGMLCTWEIDGQATAGLTVFPAGLVPSDVVERVGWSGCEEYEDGLSSTCAAAIKTSAAWIRLDRGYVDGQNLTAAPDGFPAALELIADRLERAGQPVAGALGDERWTSGDCASLAIDIDVAGRIGSDYEEGFPGYWPAGFSSAILEASGYEMSCSWYAFPDGYSAIASATLLAGAAPFWDELTAGYDGAVPVELAGADRAMTWAAAPEEGRMPSEVALVSSGSHVLRVQLDGEAADAAGFAAAVLAAR